MTRRIMRFFNGPSKRVHPMELSLSQKILNAWAAYNNRFLFYSRRRASGEFLKRTFRISDKQPNYKIYNKIFTLMQLKLNHPDPNYIPSSHNLPDDFDSGMDMDFILQDARNRCLKITIKITEYGFGDDPQMWAFLRKQQDEIKNTWVVEKIEALYLKLINILYKIKQDPVSNALREKNTTIIHKLQTCHVDSDDILLTSQLLDENSANIMEDITIEKRCCHYSERVDPEPFVRAWNALWADLNNQLNHEALFPNPLIEQIEAVNKEWIKKSGPTF